MTHRGADAVCAGITTTDDNHMFIFCGNIFAVFVAGIEQALGIGMKKIHREMDAIELAPWHRQVTRFGRAATKHNGVKLISKIGGGNIDADGGLGYELNSLGGHKIDTSLHDRL